VLKAGPKCFERKALQNQQSCRSLVACSYYEKQDPTFNELIYDHKLLKLIREVRNPESLNELVTQFMTAKEEIVSRGEKAELMKESMNSNKISLEKSVSILSDIRMPRMNGYELVSKIKALQPKVKSRLS